MLFWFFSILSLLYFVLCCFFYSPKASVLYFWPLLSLFLFLCIPYPILWRMFRIPFFLFWGLFFLFLLFLAGAKEDEGKPDVLLVLGVRCDKTLPRSLFLGRVKKAEALLKENPNLTAVLSGGKVFGEKESEAKSLKKALVRRGIDSKRLILEERSRTTFENFAFSAPCLDSYERVGVVTNSYHIFRARRTAKKRGKEFLFYSAPAPAFFLPHLALREFFTFSVDILTGHIKLFLEEPDMRKTPLIHAAASIGKVIFSILQVFSLIGAVGLLFATLSLSFLPAGMMEVDTTANVTIHFHLNRLVEGDITEYRDLLISGFEGAEITEDGFKVEEITPSIPLENRKMALSLIPSFTQMLVLFFFYRAAKGLCANLKDSPASPFTPEAPEILKSLGISLFFLAGAPWVSASLIQMITGIASDISLEMGTVLWGLFALALSEIFRIGATLAPPSFTSSDYPPHEEQKKDDATNHPNAF